MAVKTPSTWRREAVEIPLATLIELFIVSKQIEGRSQKTLDWYQAP